MNLRIGALCCAALFAAVHAAEGAELTQWERKARALLEELVEINTTDSVGDTVAASRAMAHHLLEAGFPAEDVLVTEMAPRKGNLVARLRGSSPDLDPILLLAHIDVVEANPDDWTLPPFELIEKDGILYGRGVADDKDEAAIHVVNLMRMREEGFVPERDIVVALTADEEAGEHNGVQWLLRERPDLVRAAFALNEGGGGVLRNEEHVSNNVQASEKVYQSFTLEVTNPGGHSSRPRLPNAIYQLAGALLAVREYAFEVSLNEVTQTFFERSAPLQPPPLRRAMERIAADPSDASAIAQLEAIPHYNAMLRTTCVATQLSGGHAENALPQRATATVNCRILPGEDPRDIARQLRFAIADAEVSVTPVADAKPSPPSPLTPEVLGAIEALTEEFWPGVPVIPTMSTGATDGLYLRNAGIPVYGVSGLFYGESFAHGKNERIPADAFYKGLEFLYRLTKRLAGG